MQLPRWLFIEYNVGENNNLTQLTGDYGYLASINRSDEYNNPYYLAIVFDNTDEQNLEDYIADHRISNVPTVVLFPSDKEIMLAKLIREKMGLNLQHLPYHERSDLATLVDNWLQDVARKSQSRLKSADIQIVEISEGVNMLPQVLQNAKKEEIVPEDEGRYHFLRIAEVLTRRVYNTDLQGGIIKIATQTAGPWVKSDKDGQIVNLDETLAALAKDAVLKHSREKDESAVRIVCPFSLKNLHHIRKWHTTRGVEIRINTAMDHTVFKWLNAHSFVVRELLVGFSGGTVSLPSKNDEGVTEYEIASTGFSTKDLEAFYHYDALFDDMFQKGTTLEQHGKELLSYKLADYINETFEKWNDTAISSGATVSFSERDVMLEVDWSSDSKIFSITILASKKIDASNMKKALDKMLETYELGDVVTLAISEEQ